MNEQTTRRSGGRAARRAARAAPLEQDMRPIQPGLQGGTFRPLDEAGIERIHQAALTALEEIGLADAPESGVAYLTGAGCIQGDDGRIQRTAAQLVQHFGRLVLDDIQLQPRVLLLQRG